MGYLIQQDYKKLIQDTQLSQLVGADFDLLETFELASIEDIKSYLVQKFDTAAEFTDTQLWSFGTIYYAKERVYINADAFSAAATYVTNDMVLYQGYIYYCLLDGVTGAWTANEWQVIGKQYAIFYANTPETDWNYYTSYAEGDFVFYKGKTYEAEKANTSFAPDENPAYWGYGVDYEVPGTIYIWDDDYWTAGDNRNQKMLQTVIDVVLYNLHSRVAPTNVPENRLIRYDNAIRWLKQCAKGDDITSGLQRIQPRTGTRIRYGSSLPKQNNNY